MADDTDSIFAKAGFSLPESKPKAADAKPEAKTSVSPSIFEAAGFSVPSAAKQPAQEPESNIPTPERFAAGVAKYGVNNHPEQSTLQQIREAIDPATLLTTGAANTVHDTLENATAAQALAGQGLSDIRRANYLPTTPSLDPNTWSPGGIIKTGAGLLGIPASLVTGPANALVGNPVTALTGNSDLGDRAAFVASSLAPIKGGGKVAEKVAPSTSATNALVKAIGPENVPEAISALRSNPRLAFADVSDPVRLTTQGLMAGGTPDVQGFISGAVRDRAGSRLDAANTAYTEAMGPTPDVTQMVAGLKRRAADTVADQAKSTDAALDKVMGPSTDPYTVLQDTMKKRSEEAAPLYEKALSNPVAWDDRLQQFIDDPIVKSGIAKGVKIQRLESLAENKPFKPNDYAIKGFDEAGDPILGSTPNMRTMNVVKKGLDAMVEESKDSVTGRLSEQGRAIDKVRSAFLEKLDDINPDYKAARQAWAGPSQTQDAYNRGLNIFQNRGGSTGVNSTPEALASWFNGASKSEQDAVKIGARAALNHQMRTVGDPAAKASSLLEKDVNQAKFATLFGKESADNLTRQLNFHLEDPVGKAFNEGFDVLKNRSGVNGLEDRPDFLKQWMQSATPEEVVAKRLGVRLDIDQKINSVKNGALAGQNITAIPYNQEKLTHLFGDKEASRLVRVMQDAKREADTNAAIFSGSKTAETKAAADRIKVREVGGGNPLQYVAPVAAEMLGQSAGIPGVGLTASLAAKGIHMGAQKLGQMHDIATNMQMAKNALATGPAREETINALLSHPKVISELKKRSNALTTP